jgi:two-component system NtrC family response regulator
MKKRMLLADDDAGVQEMRVRVWKSERYEVVLAGTGREAVRKFEAKRADLVLPDVKMPDLDGWEAIEMIIASHPFMAIINLKHPMGGCSNGDRE